MVYKINDKIVFGQAFSTEYGAVYTDIFGNICTPADVSNECDRNRNRDTSVTTVNEQVKRNMELGVEIIALWREYMISRPSTDKALEQLEAFTSILLALASGCLKESSMLILTMVEDEDITPEIKKLFSDVCISADHIK